MEETTTSIESRTPIVGPLQCPVEFYDFCLSNFENFRKTDEEVLKRLGAIETGVKVAAWGIGTTIALAALVVSVVSIAQQSAPVVIAPTAAPASAPANGLVP